jgi:hypothetical protein
VFSLHFCLKSQCPINAAYHILVITLLASASTDERVLTGSDVPLVVGVAMVVAASMKRVSLRILKKKESRINEDSLVGSGIKLVSAASPAGTVEVEAAEVLLFARMHSFSAATCMGYHSLQYNPAAQQSASCWLVMRVLRVIS